MATRTRIGKAATSGMLAIALAFGSVGIASAQTMQSTSTAEFGTAVSTPLNSNLEPLAAYATALEEDVSEDDLQPLIRRYKLS